MPWAVGTEPGEKQWPPRFSAGPPGGLLEPIQLSEESASLTGVHCQPRLLEGSLPTVTPASRAAVGRICPS